MLAVLLGTPGCGPGGVVLGRHLSAAPSPLVDVAATCFFMGSKPGQGKKGERPRHRVCLSPFGLERTKVSQAQYDRCVRSRRCRAARYRKRPGFGGADLPAVGVSWSDARDYCRFVGRRLPTEAEWELAACGSDGRTYPWGEKEPSCDFVSYKDCGIKHLLPIGLHSKNRGPTGTVGMVGNVWEWIADWHAADAYSRHAPRDPRGPKTGHRRVIRGGSFVDPATYLRCRARFHWTPTAQLIDVGFRCAKSR